jgi:hypothetical protein
VDDTPRPAGLSRKQHKNAKQRLATKLANAADGAPAVAVGDIPTPAADGDGLTTKERRNRAKMKRRRQ